MGRSCLDECQLSFIDSLHKITGHLTAEGKFVPNEVLHIDNGVRFFESEHVVAEIFVRESYVTLADKILADFETIDLHQRNGVILGGTPGVGKSTFLTFLLCCCYVQRKFKPHLFGDVLLHLNKDKPVHLHWDEKRTQYVCWPFSEGLNWIYLFDVVEGSFAPGNSDAYVVAACSPLADYRLLGKLDVYGLYMPVWSVNELLICHTKCGRIQPDANTIKLLFNTVGGIARQVLQDGKMDEIKLANLERYIQEGYCKYSIEDIMEVMCDPQMTPVAHRLIHMEPSKNYWFYKYVFGSSKIRQEYLTRKMNLGVDQVLGYAAMLTSQHAQSMRELFFEQVAHCLFYSGSSVLPVKQLLKREHEGVEFMWRFEVSNAKPIDGNRIKDDLQDGEYGIGTRNLNGIDAVLQPDIIFQMTSSREHKINLPGLVNTLLQMNETRKKISVLFVVPNDVYALFPFPRFDRIAPSADHEFILTENPMMTIKEMEDYVTQRVLFGVVCVDLNDVNVRIKAEAAFSRCNTDLLTVRSRDIDA